MSGSGRSWVGLALGANLGPRRKTLQQAVAMIADETGLRSSRLSGLFQSAPSGGVEGGDFLNCVLVGLTALSPMQLVRSCRGAEAAAGSPVEKRGAARRLDVDVLFMQDAEPHPPQLLLPHPRLHLRDFVLVPLSQIWKDPVPGLESTSEQLLRGLSGEIQLEELAPAPPAGTLRWEDEG